MRPLPMLSTNQRVAVDAESGEVRPRLNPERNNQHSLPELPIQRRESPATCRFEMTSEIIE
jgi:hypothetical protein